MKNEQNNNEPTRLDFIRSLIADCRYDDAMEMLQIATSVELHKALNWCAL